MSEKKKNKRNIFPDFIQYRSDKMTGKEKNSFERGLQKDPFAEEAAEGFEMFPPGDINNDMATLQKRLDKRVTRKRRMTVYRIAASIAALMVVSSVFLVIERNRKQGNRIQELHEKKVMEINEGEALHSKAHEKEKRNPAPSIAREKKNITVTASDARVKDEENAEMEVGKELQKGQVEEVPIGKRQEARAVRARIDADAVTGLPVQKSAGIRGKYVPPEPLAGIKAFEKYIYDNIRRPDTLPEQESLAVTLNFRINTQGKIDSMRILKSPGRAFSKEAGRLILSGPGWKPGSRNGKVIDDSVTLNIVFKKH
ncbi:MAG TPA: energy transducer TonB [Bacteroidales bacterium]|nr:energy transducer TonB [Bacteroidales bacterium]